MEELRRPPGRGSLATVMIDPPCVLLLPPFLFPLPSFASLADSDSPGRDSADADADADSLGTRGRRGWDVLYEVTEDEDSRKTVHTVCM